MKQINLRAAAIVFAAVGLMAAWIALSGFSDYSPGNSTIQGVGFCSNTPVTGDLLTFDGTFWCGNSSPAGNYTFGAGASQFGAQVTLTNNGNGEAQIASSDGGYLNWGNSKAFTYATLSGSQYNFTVSPAGVMQSLAGIAWDNGSDITTKFAPRSTFSGYIASIPNGSSGIYAQYYNSAAVTVRSVTAFVGASTAGCTTSAQIGVASGGTLLTGTAVTLAAGGGAAQVTGLTNVVAAAAGLQVDVSTAPAGCTTSPANINVTVEYTTN